MIGVRVISCCQTFPLSVVLALKVLKRYGSVYMRTSRAKAILILRPLQR